MTPQGPAWGHTILRRHFLAYRARFLVWYPPQFSQAPAYFRHKPRATTLPPRRQGLRASNDGARQGGRGTCSDATEESCSRPLIR